MIGAELTELNSVELPVVIRWLIITVTLFVISSLLAYLDYRQRKHEKETDKHDS